MTRDKRIATSVTSEDKLDFQIAAMRRDVSESELLREIVDDFLEEEDIPDEVREYFKEELESDQGNPKTVATAD
ncbi:hypothetical protein [Haloarcula pellucida]|nr:hypothetical protein [Halomicroarcula pellucida]MBX0350524.1 hypothetical protein [Halomicroarcula pellucida]